MGTAPLSVSCSHGSSMRMHAGRSTKNRERPTFLRLRSLLLLAGGIDARNRSVTHRRCSELLKRRFSNFVCPSITLCNRIGLGANRSDFVADRCLILAHRPCTDPILHYRIAQNIVGRLVKANSHFVSRASLSDKAGCFGDRVLDAQLRAARLSSVALSDLPDKPHKASAEERGAAAAASGIPAVAPRMQHDDSFKRRVVEAFRSFSDAGKRRDYFAQHLPSVSFELAARWDREQDDKPAVPPHHKRRAGGGRKAVASRAEEDCVFDWWKQQRAQLFKVSPRDLMDRATELLSAAHAFLKCGRRWLIRFMRDRELSVHYSFYRTKASFTELADSGRIATATWA